MSLAYKKIKRDDQVTVIAGKEKGKSGRVLKVDRKLGRIIIQEINMVKKATKPRRQNERGGIIEVEAPIDISNVMVVCGKCGPTRVGFSIKEEGKTKTKTRICKKCGDEL